jgi:hypothetical protein
MGLTLDCLLFAASAPERERGQTMPEILEASLSDKMAKAFDLSIELWKLDEAKEYKALKRDEEADFVYGWADGLCHKYYQNMATGHCSPQATIDFDVGVFEESVDRDIVRMQKILVRLNNEVA